jgi:hypothetical protein
LTDEALDFLLVLVMLHSPLGKYRTLKCLLPIGLLIPYRA